MKRSLLFSIIFFICLSSFSQNNDLIDSLRKVIATVEMNNNKPCSADTGRINAYLSLAVEIRKASPDSAQKLNFKAKEIAEKLLESNPSKSIKSSTNKYLAKTLNNIGNIFTKQGNIYEALNCYHKSLKISEEIGDKKGISDSYNNLGNITKNQGDIPKALDYILKSLSISEELGDKRGMARTYNNLGLIYFNQEETDKAMEYHHKSLKIKEEIGDKKGMAKSLNNLAVVYKEIGETAKALEYNLNSLKIKEELEDIDGIATSYNNLGDVYNELNDFPKAIECLHKSLKILSGHNNKKGMCLSLYLLGMTYQKQKNIKNAKIYSKQAYQISKELGFPIEIELAASLMKEISIMEGNYKKAFEYYQEEIQMHDSIQSDEFLNEITRQQTKHEYEKQMAVDSVAYAKSIQIKDLELAKSQQEKEKQKVVIFAFIGGFIVILVFLIIVLRLFLQKKKANRIITEKNVSLNKANIEIQLQKKEIEIQRDEITEQHNEIVQHRDIILQQKEKIEDSIQYAKRIQNAVLPNINYANSILGEHFIIFNPKDVVSGDFYWATQVKDWVILTVADCTGHGVPGAFMSMLGVSFLNEIVQKNEITNAALVLNKLRASIIEALKQTGEDGDQKDGMDITLVAINTENKLCYWAGANNPLWLIRNSNLNKDYKNITDVIEVIKPDKMPISVHIQMTDFTNHTIQLFEGDKLYLFSDGFADQFGGPKGKKFMSAAFKKLIVETSHMPMIEQGKHLEKAFKQWISYEGEKFEQLDDVTVIGLKIS
ncbi:MAG: tetratricopeptide repeat protein [Saprospiraceae bacterium]|nr:tetratricopeptide repeat protein [Saprospiraceae bacterium]